jgi:hypothetical protein
MNEEDGKRFLGATPSETFPKPPPHQPVTNQDTREVDDYFDRVEREVYAVLREREKRRSTPQPVTIPKPREGRLFCSRHARSPSLPFPSTPDKQPEPISGSRPV